MSFKQSEDYEQEKSEAERITTIVLQYIPMDQKSEEQKQNLKLRHLMLKKELKMKTQFLCIMEYEMEYVVWAKGPALGPVRSFSADRRRREKRNKRDGEERIQQNLLRQQLAAS